MPVFEVDSPSGTFEVDAPTFDAAVGAIRSGRAAKAGIGYGRAIAQGAVIDTPAAFGGIADLLNPYSRMAAQRGLPSFEQQGRSLGEGLIGPRQQGTVGEERAANVVRGALTTVPFAFGGGPLAAALTVAGGGLADVAQSELTRRGVNPIASTGVGALINIASGIAAKNISKVGRGVAELTAQPAEQMAAALDDLRAKPPVAAEAGAVAPRVGAVAGGTPVAPMSDQKALELAAASWNPSEVPARVAVDEVLKKRGIAIPENLRLPELENAPRFDLDKTIRDVADASKERITALRGGVQSWDKTAELGELARKAGLDYEVVSEAAKKRAYSAAELHAINDVFEESMTRTHFSRQAFLRDPTKENLARFSYDAARAGEVMSRLVSGTSEAGRTLQVIQKFQKNFDVARAADRIIKEAGGYKNAELVAETLGALSDPAAQADFLRRVAQKAPTHFQQFVEYYKASLLTGLGTHGTNIVSNTAFGALKTAEKAIASTGRAIATGSTGPLYELAGHIYGARQGVRNGFRFMWEQLKNETPEGFGKAAETAGPASVRGAIPGRVGKVVRVPFRALGAEDAAFRNTFQQMSLEEQAWGSAYREGLRWKALLRRAGEIAAHPTDAMLATAKDYGERLVFQTDLGRSGRAFQHFLANAPAAQLVVPFFKTPTNILKEAIYRTPLGLAAPENLKDLFMRGGKARAEAITRVAMGSSVMAWIFNEALDGNITGSGPSDPAKRRVWLETNSPSSFRLPGSDKWIGIPRIEPFATILTTAADLADLYQSQKNASKSLKDVPGQLALIMANNLGNKTFLRNLSNFGLAMTQPQQYGEQFLRDSVAGAIPFSGLLGNVARTEDPAVREVRSVLDAVKNKIPGQRETLPIKISPVSGEEVRLGGAVGPDIISPFYERPVNADPVALEMQKIGMGKMPPDRPLGLTDDQYDKLQRETGKRGHARALKLIQTGRYKALDAHDKKQKIANLYAKERKTVLRMLGYRPPRS